MSIRDILPDFGNALHQARLQRNVACVLACVVLVVCVFLSITLSLQDTKIVVVPPGNFTKFTVGSHSASASYVYPWVRSVLEMRMSKSSENALEQSASFLRFVAPSQVSAMRTQLKVEDKQYKRLGIITDFKITDVSIDTAAQVASVSGVMKRWIGDSERQDDERLKVSIGYRVTLGQPFVVTGFEINKGDAG